MTKFQKVYRQTYIINYIKSDNGYTKKETCDISETFKHK